ncbi:MAG: tetratricopeptide repeat protein [Burkholderiales bacterium]|nr:tetratricopeptide repeat protein [Burkholderiales bacterium]
MAAYDLDEQEKLGDLKAWWAQYGNYVTAIFVVAALAIAGAQGWKWWQNKQSVEASTLYFALSEAAGKNEMPKLKDALAQLLEKYAGTAYAPRGALLAAKASFDAGDLASAKTQLDWVVANSKEDELKSIARLRLATVLLDQKQYDAALAALDGKHSESFAGLFLDMKGDVFALQGKTADAKTAYEAALAKLDPKGGQKQYTQLKLDSVSGAGTAPSVAPAVAAPAAPAEGAKK